MAVRWIDGSSETGTTDAEAAAIQAARAGRLPELERSLELLGRREPGRARELGERLRSVARSVRAHPSYSASTTGGLRAAM